MWKILGLLVLCGLLSPSEEKQYANRVVFSASEIAKVFSTAILKDGDLLNHLKGIPLSNVYSGGGLLNLVSGLLGLTVVDLKPARNELILLPAITGADLIVSVYFDITGHTLLNVVRFSMEVTFRVRYSLVDFRDNAFRIAIRDCRAEVGVIKTSLLDDLLTTSLLDMLHNVLAGDFTLKVCQFLKAPMDLAISYLVGTINVPLSMVPYGTMKCALAAMPVVYDTFGALDIFIDFETPDRGVLSIPDSAGSIAVPPLKNFRYCQSFHPALINNVLSVLAPREPQELTCTPDKFSGANELRGAILALVPAENRAIVSESVLNIQISPVGDPTIAFRIEGIIILATLQVEVFLRKADASIYSVLVVKTSVTLRAVLSVGNGKLIFVAFFSGNALLLTSSNAGITEVSSLKPHCGNLVKEKFLPVFNGRLAVGIPALPVYNIVLINPTISFFEGALVACL